MRALLISNSGRPFLEHCREAIAEFLGDKRRVAFVTAASYDDENAYWQTARTALAPAGIDVVAAHLGRMMKEELSERVETVYAEEYAWPLALAMVLLAVEAFVAEAPRRRRRRGRDEAEERKLVAPGLERGGAPSAPPARTGRGKRGGVDATA